MHSFRQINKQTLLLWSLLLCLTLLYAQEAILHVHNADHVHVHAVETHTHSATEAADYHGHFITASFVDDHHEGVATEVDISPDGLLKNVNSSSHFSIALFALFFILIICSTSQRFVRHWRDSKLILYRFYAISPPSRAPPQH